MNKNYCICLLVEAIKRQNRMSRWLYRVVLDSSQYSEVFDLWLHLTNQNRVSRERCHKECHCHLEEKIELYKRTYIFFFNGCVLFSDFLHHMDRSKVDVDIKMLLSPDYGQSSLSYRITFHIATSDLANPIMFYSYLFLLLLFFCSFFFFATSGNCGKFHP